jgi:hypothetical protein
VHTEKRQAWLAIAAFVGAAVGIFWLFAIDAGRNFAQWPPNPDTWLARLSCPFIPLVGVSNLANFLVPLLNSLIYVLTLWCLLPASRLLARHSK